MKTPGHSPWISACLLSSEPVFFLSFFIVGALSPL